MEVVQRVVKSLRESIEAEQAGGREAQVGLPGMPEQWFCCEQSAPLLHKFIMRPCVFPTCKGDAGRCRPDAHVMLR